MCSFILNIMRLTFTAAQPLLSRSSNCEFDVPMKSFGSATALFSILDDRTYLESITCRALKEKTVSPLRQSTARSGARGVIRGTTRGITGTRSGRVAR